MQVSERIADVQRRYADLNDEMALLSKLPEGLDVTSVFTLRGHWHVNAAGPLHELLALLPPSHAKMVLNNGTWEAIPENAPVSWEQRVLPLLKTKSGVSWHHYLADGTCLSVKAENAGLSALDGYSLAISHHADVLVRKVRQPATPVTSPEEQDQAAWDTFYETEAYTPRQKQFARAIHTAVRYSRKLSMDMLPVPAASTMNIAGSTLQVLHAGAGPDDKVPEGSHLHALPRIGRFWDFFTKEQAERLVEFANAHCQDLQEAQLQAVHAAVEAAKAALAKFEQQYLQNPVANAPDDVVLTHWVRKETGLPVTVSLRDTVSRRYGTYEVWFQLWRFHESGKLTVPSDVYDPAGFNFQNPPFYEYEENAGHF